MPTSTTTTWRAEMDCHGYATVRDAVPLEITDAALRRLHIEVVRRGLTADEIREWSVTTFFPHLRWEPEILAVRDALEELVGVAPGEDWADTQLLCRFPDEAADWPLSPHVDGAPDWAPERPYSVVVGVALTPSRHDDGCLVVWPRSHREHACGGAPTRVELDPGGCVLMHPRLHHSSSLNRSPRPRWALYFRLLASCRAVGSASSLTT